MRTSTKRWLKKYLDDLPGYKSPAEDLAKTKKKAKDKERMLMVLSKMQKIIFEANGFVRDVRNPKSAVALFKLLGEFQKIYNGIFLQGCNAIKQW